MNNNRPEYTQKGGGRFGYYWIAHSAVSSVTITISDTAINFTTTALFCTRDYVFERACITRIEPYRGPVANGIRIHHSKPDIPLFVVFFASNVTELNDAIARFGYSLHKS
jgi:hypothetical protein